MRALPAGRAAGVIRVPGSKSAAIRALAVAALDPGRTTIHGGDLYEYTEAMLRDWEGFGVPAVAGESWEVNGGSLRAPEGPIDCGESGLSARIAMAMAATVDGETTITGRGRLLERPMAPLVEILRSQHIEVRASTGGTLPLTVNGRGGWWGGEIVVPTDTSTQFLTAVLLAAPTARYQTAVRAVGDGGAIGYVGMTLDVMAGFGVRVIEAAQGFEVPNSGYRAGSYGVPPDASSAVYPAVAAAITGGEVTILGLDANDRQPDMEVFEHLRAGVASWIQSRQCPVIGPDRPDHRSLHRGRRRALGARGVSSPGRNLTVSAASAQGIIDSRRWRRLGDSAPESSDGDSSPSKCQQAGAASGRTWRP